MKEPYRSLRSIPSKLILLTLSACSLFNPGSDGGDTAEALSDEVLEAQLAGAGGRNVVDDWPRGEAGTANTKLLNYTMLRAEVLRSTGRTWLRNGEDQWQRVQMTLGNTDFDERWAEDRIPDQTKLSVIRSMALDIAKDLVDTDSKPSNRSYFVDLDPSQRFDTTDSVVRKTIRDIYERVMLASPGTQDEMEIQEMLASVQETDSPSVAWQAYIASLLSSMRFLSY